MRQPDAIRVFGLAKLAEMPPESSSNMMSPHLLGQMVAVPSRALDVATQGTFSAPTPREAEEMNSYARAGVVGGLSGAALSAIVAAMLKRPMLPHLAVGTGSGLLSGIARQYDQSSDPPGLSPVYTIPSGLRLGALTGALAGIPLGRATGMGVFPGILSGALSGAAGGGAVSSFV